MCILATDIKGTFHAKMGMVKDRNHKDLTEAEEIKKRWQEYVEQKSLGRHKIHTHACALNICHCPEVRLSVVSHCIQISGFTACHMVSDKPPSYSGTMDKSSKTSFHKQWSGQVFFKMRYHIYCGFLHFFTI